MTIKPPTAFEIQHKALVKQTQKWVAQTFYGTLLKQSRESPFKSDMMSGGRGGQAFGSMLDMQMAERMAKGSGNKLVNSIVNKIEQLHGNGQPKPRNRHGVTTQPYPGGAK